MLFYQFYIDISEEIDVNETSTSKECDICHYWYFLDKVCNFQSDIYNGCHFVLMLSINFKDIAILNIWDIDYHCIINGISKSDALNLLQNADLTKERRVL